MRFKWSIKRGLGWLCLTVAALSGGCAVPGNSPVEAAASTARVRSVRLSDVGAPSVNDQGVSLSAAKNEWASFQLEVTGLPEVNDKTIHTLRFQPPQLQSQSGSISADQFKVYQILPMPVDVNRAGYIRHTGQSAATRLMPRALLPMPVNSGRANLSAARDPVRPTDPKSRAGSSTILLWVDLQIPPETPAGAYLCNIEVLQTGVELPIAKVPLSLTVYDFVLPDERHLNLVGQVEWENLIRLYPNEFEAVTPRFITRKDGRYAPAVNVLDQLVVLAQAHRVEVVIPRLQPTVKWPGGRPPQVSWEEFDSLVAPWLKGDAFADKVPLGYWPLPGTDGLFNYDPKSQREYWAEAATHFDQNDWLDRCPVFLEKVTPGRASAIEAIKISSDAGSVLSSHPRVKVVVPLEDDQVQFAIGGNPSLIRPDDTPRLITSNPGIVFSTPIQSWPTGVTRPKRWLRTDLTGLIPYVGAGGDERDVRLWAWLSSLPLPPPALGVQYGPVTFIRWVGVLPSNSDPAQAADPAELIWFYPGSWFGVDQPVPTIQLKWLRRAQQDYEYLYLARQRGEITNALYMSRLITKPVELTAAQQPDPTYALMCGTSDQKAWDQAIDLLAKRILLREPGQPVDRDRDRELNIETLQWSYPQERPVIVGRTTQWAWDAQRSGETWIRLRLGIDVYNASDSTPDENQLAWTSVPELSGWQVSPRPLQIPSLATYHVQRYAIDASVDPAKLRKIDRRPVAITFTHGFTKKTSLVQMLLPVVATERREGLLSINGSLEDWSVDDAIQNGPMLRLFNRPAIQRQELEAASTPTQLFTGWADENFYLAFRLTGLSQTPIRTVQNFVNYQFRRAWGEDLCQMVIQPVYADGSLGPVLHVVCKPTGGFWVERKMDPRLFADPWQAFEGTGLRYAATIDGADWRGEVAIPWKAIISDNRRELPVMLRFNFTQHRHETGESASWAGPIDFGRDDAFTGVLVLREPQNPGMRPNPMNPR